METEMIFDVATKKGWLTIHAVKIDTVSLWVVQLADEKELVPKNTLDILHSSEHKTEELARWFAQGMYLGIDC